LISWASIDPVMFCNGCTLAGHILKVKWIDADKKFIIRDFSGREKESLLANNT